MYIHIVRLLELAFIMLLSFNKKWDLRFVVRMKNFFIFISYCVIHSISSDKYEYICRWEQIKIDNIKHNYICLCVSFVWNPRRVKSIEWYLMTRLGRLGTSHIRDFFGFFKKRIFMCDLKSIIKFNFSTCSAIDILNELSLFELLEIHHKRCNLLYFFIILKNTKGNSFSMWKWEKDLLDILIVNEELSIVLLIESE